MCQADNTNPNETINFNIKFITPLLLHGKDSREPDAQGLAKALRGAWRFWFRAVVGGMLWNPSISDNELSKCVYDRESKVFGSADEKDGAKFRMLVEPVGEPVTCETPIRFSQRTVPFTGFREGCKFKITIRPRNGMIGKERDILLCVIWLWGNLGALGQRSRRGFGSPVLVKESAKIPDWFSVLIDEPAFDSREELEHHLIKGLQEVLERLSKLDGLDYSGLSILDNDPPINAPYFILRSPKQIAVGEVGFKDAIETPGTVADGTLRLKSFNALKGIDIELDPFTGVTEALQKVHGNNACPSLGWVVDRNCWMVTAYPKESNFSPQRMASPIHVRLWPTSDDNLIPLAVWCQHEVSIKAKRWQGNANVEVELDKVIIPEQTCLKKYLTGGTCGHGVVFKDSLSFSKDLRGDDL